MGERGTPTMTFQEFINMGGYGAFVWGCYGAALVIFLALYFGFKVQNKKLVNQLKRKYRQEQREQQNHSKAD